ncbi:hypothetical protein ACP275_11G084100 [Erythranthe tilingii]
MGGSIGRMGFAQFPTWLEYSPTTDAAYCLPCYLFASKSNARFGANAFTGAGFRNWKKVNEKKTNRLRLKTSIDCVRWLAYQSCPSRGHDEGPKSTNPGSFIEMVKLSAMYNNAKKAPHNAKCTSRKIQKEILHIIATKQMALVLRFVNKVGVLQERFFETVSVKDTTALTLKCELSTILSNHALSVDNLRGQGYDGASNMRVKTSSEVILGHRFFTKLDSIVNIVGASTKRNGELITAQRAEISRLISISELETGKGANQIGTLQRVGNTPWVSYFYLICSLLKMFNTTGIVLQGIIVDGANFFQRGDADSAYSTMTSFQFVFILILMKEIIGVTDVLYYGWDGFLSGITSFCEGKDIKMPDMNGAYKVGRKSIHQPRDINITIEHNFYFDIFNTTVDTQLKELNSRFCDQTVELLTLSLALDPSNSYKSFNADDICTFFEKYYPGDFTERVIRVPTLATLCEGLAQTKKSDIYYLVDRLIRLILLLHVCTATTERAISVMKLTKLQNKMEDEFLGDCMLLYIERDIADTFSTDSIIPPKF